MRCVVCRGRPFVKWSWSGEARFAVASFAETWLLLEARRERTLSVVQPDNRGGGGCPASHGSAESAGEEDLPQLVCARAVGV